MSYSVLTGAIGGLVLAAFGCFAGLYFFIRRRQPQAPGTRKIYSLFGESAVVLENFKGGRETL